MKKLLRLSELKRYYEEKSLSKIIYCTDNQELDGENGFQSIGITFRSIFVSISPNLIILKTGDGYIRFSCVYYAELETGTSILGDKVTIYCRKNFGRPTDGKYVLYLQ